MKNEKICIMINDLEERSGRTKKDLLESLKTEENLELAVKIFKVSNQLRFKRNGEFGKVAEEQALYTTVQCLNALFDDQKIDFFGGNVPLWRILEIYLVDREHIHFLEGYKENDSAILFKEEIDIAMDVSKNIIWMAEIDMGKIEYTLLEDECKQMYCIDTDRKPEKELMEKVKKWYIDNGFEFKE